MDSPLGDKSGLEPFTGLLSSIFDNFENFFEEHKNELDLEKIFKKNYVIYYSLKLTE
jgi:hypothetical protein